MARRRSKKRKSSKSGLSEGVKQSIVAVILAAIGVLVLLSIFGSGGSVGIFVNDSLAQLFGWDRWVIGVFLFVAAWGIMFPDRFRFGGLNIFGMLLFFLACNSLIHLLIIGTGDVVVEEVSRAGGYLGVLIATPLMGAFGPWGAGVIAAAVFAIGLFLSFDLSLHKLSALPLPKLPKRERTEDEGDWYVDDAEEETEDEEDEDEEVIEDDIEEDEDEEESVAVNGGRPKAVVAASDQDEEQVMTSTRRRRVQIPADLLDDSGTVAQSGDVERNQEIIRRTFENFNIDVEMVDVRVGPTVTRYSLRPAQGIKLSRIVGLQNDLALALAAHPIRIEAPIPGKSLVGIEVPNQSVGTVSLRELLESKEFKNRKSSMMAPLGKDVTGTVRSVQVDKAPHMLVAGATGSGKSVCLNIIITALLYQNGPDDVKFIFVDPKRVELGVYAGIPHLLVPPITSSDDAINALKWAVREMERRLDHLSKFGARDIDSYNKKSKERMPKIVIVIDELADLMSQNKRDVEAVIVRIAQMARAAGIHLVLATQRPSVDVITGTIKANIPTRLAFAVASQVDSKTILDTAGAEKLLGRGDMLMSTPELSKPRRAQGAYVSDSEIERVVKFLKKEGEPDYNYQVTEDTKTGGTVFSGDDSDDLLDEAIQIVVEAGKASTSYLQRRLRIGYSRAARIVDLLEEAGIISEARGSKPREVLVDQWPPASEETEAVEEDFDDTTDEEEYDESTEDDAEYEEYDDDIEEDEDEDDNDDDEYTH